MQRNLWVKKDEHLENKKNYMDPKWHFWFSKRLSFFAQAFARVQYIQVIDKAKVTILAKFFQSAKLWIPESNLLKLEKIFLHNKF
jgi:hypothetical protein